MICRYFVVSLERGADRESRAGGVSAGVQIGSLTRRSVLECRQRVKDWRGQHRSADRESGAGVADRESNLETSAGVQTGKLVQEAERDYSVFQKGSDFQSVGKPMREVSTMG